MESSYSQYDFDYYQADSSVEPLAIGFYLPLADVYAFDPAPADLADPVRVHILGAQGQLWTEFMPDSNHAEYMAFLRVAALSEMVWSPQASRSYADFQARLPAHLERLDVLGVNYRPLGNDDQTLSGQFQTFLMRTAMSFYFWLIQP
ncbi:MAG: hexosaminidase [Bacteroidia bacterium]